MVAVCNTRDESCDLIDLLFDSEDGFGIVSVCLYVKAKDLYACHYGDALFHHQRKIGLPKGSKLCTTLDWLVDISKSSNFW